VFCLLFKQRNWFRIQESEHKPADYPAKDGICDEFADLDWVVALTKLLKILNGVAEKADKRIAEFIKCQLSQWIAALPNYIKVCLPISICES